MCNGSNVGYVIIFLTDDRGHQLMNLLVGFISSFLSAATVPGCALRVISLRTKSTIITFSAISLGLFRSSSLIRSSSAGVLPRGAVPLMGWEISVSPRFAKKRSGEADIIYSSPALKNVENGVGEISFKS